MRRLINGAALLAIGLAGPSCGPRATSAPSAFAWHELLTASRPFPQDKTLATWETWISKEKLFLGDSPAPPRCAASYPQKVLQVSVESQIFAALETANRDSLTVRPLDGLNFEVRFNRVFCDDVVRPAGPALWKIPNGLYKLFELGKDATFPNGSVAVKAYWDHGPCSPERYHCGSDASGPLRLRAIHLAAKQPDTTNWFWATWEHEDEISNPGYPGLCCKDDFGFVEGKPTARLLALIGRNGLGHEWSHYRLIGTQFDYTENGSPARLGNVVIEGPANAFRVSCITCHVRATTD
jgi:hypothetical protein